MARDILLGARGVNGLNMVGHLQTNTDSYCKPYIRIRLQIFWIRYKWILTSYISKFEYPNMDTV
jgi:hypothetical protein